MIHARLAGALLLIVATLHAVAAPASEPIAPLLDGMGAYTRPTGSNTKLAQRYFDQGMVLTWGFNPAEAARSFEAATRADPKCAICWWGLAWSLGPNINSDMIPSDAPRARAALDRALALSPARPQDRALVDALATRHPRSGAPAALDEEGYASAMLALAKRYPKDADIQTLAAEAVLNLHPYDWWEADGNPKPWTMDIERLLASALAANPKHPGANHYLVHVMESSQAPERGAAAAKALENVAPGSGHLVHMPAHIYMRVGRYADASAANERSIKADERYVAQVQAQGAYLVGYAAHNHHFLWASAAMEGRSRAALDAARATYRVACGPNPGDLRIGTMQHYYALPYYALVRFGRWDEILTDTPPPDVTAPYPLAIWHYARGMAFLRTGKLPEAKRELATLERLAADPAMKDVKVKNINFAASLARIAVLTLSGEIALAEGRTDAGLTQLAEAVAIEDTLEYDEPHLWLAPTRHALGAALLAAGRPARAERVYREDLAHYPDNGWSLSGLAEALAQQGRTQEAQQMRQRFEAAWKNADFPLAPGQVSAKPGSSGSIR
jgi:tetratricopeptide (TPR) repeat protein